MRRAIIGIQGGEGVPVITGSKGVKGYHHSHTGR